VTIVYSLRGRAIVAIVLWRGLPGRAAKPVNLIQSIAEYRHADGWLLRCVFHTLTELLRTEEYGAELAPVPAMRRHPPPQSLRGARVTQQLVLALLAKHDGLRRSAVSGREASRRIAGTIAEVGRRSLAEEPAAAQFELRTHWFRAESGLLLKALTDTCLPRKSRLTSIHSASRRPRSSPPSTGLGAGTSSPGAYVTSPRC